MIPELDQLTVETIIRRFNTSLTTKRYPGANSLNQSILLLKKTDKNTRCSYHQRHKERGEWGAG